MPDMKEKIRSDALFAYADAVGSQHLQSVALDALVVYPLGDCDTEPQIIKARDLLESVRMSVPAGCDRIRRYRSTVLATCRSGALSAFDARVVSCAAGLEDSDLGDGADTGPALAWDLKEVACG